MERTIYANYTDAELLTAFSRLRYRSPVIEELCARLEGSKAEELSYDRTVTCPVCMADIRLDVDRSDNDLVVSVFP